MPRVRHRSVVQRSRSGDLMPAISLIWASGFVALAEEVDDFIT